MNNPVAATLSEANTGLPSLPGRWLLPLLPNLLWMPSAALALVFVFTYSVDIPYIDQWDGELPLLRKAAAGEAGFSDVIAQHMEHRFAITHMANLFVAWIADWRPRVLLCITWLFVCGIAFTLSILNRLTNPPNALRFGVPALLGGALLFGLQQFDSWLNPEMLSWISVEVLLVVGLVVASSELSSLVKFVACGVLAAVATFSNSNGLLAWLLFPPVLLVGELAKRSALDWRYLGGWGVGATLTIGRYFWDYQKPPESPSLLAGFNDPALAVRFFLTNVGSPFAFGTAVNPMLQAFVAGLLISVVAAICTAFVATQHRNLDLVRRTLPWLCMIAYAMATEFAISLGRAGLGMDAALASRYMPTPILTVYSLIVLVPMICDQAFMGERSEIATLVKGSLFTLAALGHVLCSLAMVPTYENERARLSAAKAAVLFSRLFRDGQLLANVWSHKTVVDLEAKLDFLDENRYLRPRTFKSTNIRDLMATLSHQQKQPVGQCGAMDQASRPGQDTVAFGGWAISADHVRPAGAVLLTWERDGEGPNVFGIVPVGGGRPDIAEKLATAGLAKSGWGRVFPKDQMPKESATIRAWAFDVDTGTASELAGTADWSPDKD